MTDRMLSAALGYAEQFSWAVLPLRVREKAPAIPKCRGGRGYFDATTDLETIERLWREYPDSNVGVSCIGSGFVALDVDPRHRGDRTLAEIERRYGPLPHTVRQLTGGGGEHILFGAPRDLQPRGSIGAGIDVKWRGFIVAAPSVHPHTHRPYVWMPDYHPLRTAIAVPPEWLLELLFPSNQLRTANRSDPVRRFQRTTPDGGRSRATAAPRCYGPARGLRTHRSGSRTSLWFVKRFLSVRWLVPVLCLPPSRAMP